MNTKPIRDYAMDDSTFLKWLLGLVASMGLLLFSWTHKRSNAAHTKIDQERKDNEVRINLCYEKIAETVNKTEACRIKIEKDIAEHMTEVQIKDFVDRSIKPVQTQISAVDARINTVHEDVKTILTEVRK